MFEKLINKGESTNAKALNKNGQVSFVTPTREWLPKAIKSMQEGNPEEIERLPCETPLKNDLLQFANGVARNRNPNSQDNSITERILNHAAHVSEDYLTKTYGSTPFLRAVNAANLGVPAEVLGLIAYNEELAPFAQTLLCSATHGQFLRLDIEARRLELEENNRLENIDRSKNAHNFVEHISSVMDGIFLSAKVWNKVKIDNDDMNEAINKLWVDANDALALSIVLEQNITRPESKDRKRIGELSEIAANAQKASLALAI